MPAGRFKPVGVRRVHPQQGRIPGDRIVEPAGEGLEEGIAPSALVQRRRPGHAASLVDGGSIALGDDPEAGGSVDGYDPTAGRHPFTHSTFYTPGPVARCGALWWSCRVAGVLVAVLAALALAGCGQGNAAATDAANRDFLSEVHAAAPDIGSYRNDVQLERIGHAACDGFHSGASYEELADRLPLLEGSNLLPSADLGAVINAAVDVYCAQYRSMIE